MLNYVILSIFTMLIMIMVGCSHNIRKPQPIPFRIPKTSDEYRNCVLGFIRVGVQPSESGLLCDKALSCKERR